ncbi:hypothetical protein BDP27DRAFT_1005472 [Rhodocollybia butyracea]|uniref:Uncharacterized protein n=1 Tax=Rhodocollybia butyracea TaxID=206335 RepID=A0A9P5U493_9AGAR|nr:hypothetical protein BDP27DRAFT_1005472 [Rhodocollybia butyracea]
MSRRTTRPCVFFCYTRHSSLWMAYKIWHLPPTKLFLISQRLGNLPCAPVPFAEYATRKCSVCSCFWRCIQDRCQSIWWNQPDGFGGLSGIPVRVPGFASPVLLHEQDKSTCSRIVYINSSCAVVRTCVRGAVHGLSNVSHFPLLKAQYKEIPA